MDKPDDLQQCEIFLRAILALSGPEAAEAMWQDCRRHEWYSWDWDSTQERIVQLDDDIYEERG